LLLLLLTFYLSYSWRREEAQSLVSSARTFSPILRLLRLLHLLLQFLGNLRWNLAWRLRSLSSFASSSSSSCSARRPKQRRTTTRLSLPTPRRLLARKNSAKDESERKKTIVSKSLVPSSVNVASSAYQERARVFGFKRGKSTRKKNGMCIITLCDAPG